MGQGLGQDTSIEQLLAQADRAQPVRAAELRVEAAKLAQLQGDEGRVTSILEGIDPNNLPPNVRFDIARLQAGVAINRRDSGTALRFLNPTQFTALTPFQEVELSKLRAEAYDQQSNSLAAAIELISVAQTESGEEQRQLHAEIWRLLQQTDTETLVSASFNNYGFYEQGWIELALSLGTAGDLETQRDSLLQWQQLWDSHPANQNPPRALSALISAELVTARRILIALPFSQGFAKPAQMIADGIAAARFERVSQGLPVPELLSVDTEQFSNASDIIAYAQSVQADLIIGPLKPELIDQMASLGRLPIPTIAFNQSTIPATGLYQLDLSSDQEINQIVQRAAAEGVKRVALITPSAPWGQRIKDSYVAALDANQVGLSATLEYDASADFSAQVGKLLNTDLSSARFAEIRRILGQKIQFDERPRRDIDAILLTAEPQEARQIKPMLAFHFAGNYPVYASSHVYEGDANPTRDIDLNGISFPDLPWTLNAQSALHMRLATERTDTSSRLGRLYALGADAFNIHPYLLQLEGSKDIYFEGQTGRLSIDAQRRVTRKLTWAQFDQGAPVLLDPGSIPAQPEILEEPTSTPLM